MSDTTAQPQEEKQNSYPTVDQLLEMINDAIDASREAISRISACGKVFSLPNPYLEDGRMKSALRHIDIAFTHCEDTLLRLMSANNSIDDDDPKVQEPISNNN